MSKLKELNALKSECLECRKCELGGKFSNEGKTCNVFSNMNLKSRIMLVGQSPGYREVIEGIPFVGVSGRNFKKAIEDIHLNRSDFYITNIVKCSSTEDKPPNASEIDSCSYIFEKEIEIVKPIVILSLGGTALKLLTNQYGIKRLHGIPIYSKKYNIDVFPMFHPSPLNFNNADLRKNFYDDLKNFKRFLFKKECEQTIYDNIKKGEEEDKIERQQEKDFLF